MRHAKARAIKKSIEFTITEDDIVLPEYCPILGIKLSRDSVRTGYSLDKKDPSKGYTPDNVWVISQLANAMKWDSNH